MTATRAPSIGSDAARAVIGYSAGADAVLLDTGDSAPVAEVLQSLGTVAPRRVSGELDAQLLALADELDRSSAVALVAAEADLRISEAALLDLLDRPGVRTAALVAEPTALVEGRDAASPARVGRDGRLVESVGTAVHTVTSPSHALPGVLRVAAHDRTQAACLLRASVPYVEPRWSTDAVSAAVLVLVRGGMSVQASTLGPFDWERGAVRARGADGDQWRQRLRGASRGGDGFFSTFVVRPVSRRITAVGLRHDWSPNTVTVASLAMGVLAALLVATGYRPAWVAAAVLLLLALAVDCVDGEIARFTRRFSPLGAFLDAVGDRVKEYAVLAAVAAVAVREGDPGWPVALAAMGAVTLRHLEDYAYEHRLGFSRRSRPDLLPVTDPHDSGSSGAPRSLPGAPSRRSQAVHWTKKVIHMPIGERYLLIALTLLTFRPMLVLWTLFVAVVLAVGWTQGGRVVAVLIGRDPTWRAVSPSEGAGHLDHQLDLGPLARAARRLGRLPFTVGLTGGLILAATALALWLDLLGLALAMTLVGVVLVGMAWQPPVHHPLAWQAPAALWVAEVLVVGVLVHAHLGSRTAAGFVFVAAVAYHRYDVVYRLRDTGIPPADWLALAGLGTDGRIVALVALALLLPAAVVPALWVSAAALALLYLAESVRGWRHWIAGQARPQVGSVLRPGGGA